MTMLGKILAAIKREGVTGPANATAFDIHNVRTAGETAWAQGHCHSVSSFLPLSS